MSDEKQTEMRKTHTELGAHSLQTLFMTPLLHLDMWRMGADQLHLIYLNFFKHLFKYTCHENLPDSKKNVRDYMKQAGYYSMMPPQTMRTP